jgi:protein-S-isoprenylcysteine O-methyltransferase Ste14
LTEAIIILANHFNSPSATAVAIHFCPSASSYDQAHKSQHNLAISSSFLIALAVLVLGGLVRMACYHALGSLFTFRIAIRKNHKLVTSGPYAYVRHPAYLGAPMLVLGYLCALFARGSYLTECLSLGWKPEILLGIVLAFVIIYPSFSRAITEDKLLRKEFGREWDDWAMRVRYRIFPGIW